MHNRKYMFHKSDKCFGKLSYQQSVKEVMGGYIGNRAESIKNYNKYEHKWKKELKALKKQNKMLYIISKKYSSRRKLKNINNIKAEASRNHRYSVSNSSSIDLCYDSSLSSEIDL